MTARFWSEKEHTPSCQIIVKELFSMAFTSRDSRYSCCFLIWHFAINENVLSQGVKNWTFFFIDYEFACVWHDLVSGIEVKVPVTRSLWSPNTLDSSVTAHLSSLIFLYVMTHDLILNYVPESSRKTGDKIDRRKFYGNIAFFFFF